MTKTLDDIMSGRGTPAPEVNEPAKEAPLAPQPEAAPVEAPEVADATGADKPEADKDVVPQAALHAERQKVKRYTEEVADMRRQMAEMQSTFQQQLGLLTSQLQQRAPQQPQPEPPDWYADPQAAFQHNLAPIQQETAVMREQFSRMLAAEKFGEQTVSAAQSELEKYIQTNPQMARFDYQRIMASPHPYAALVEWHNQRSALTEIGPDPKAYREKVRAEILAEMQAGRPAAPAIPPSAMPSNFATTRSAAPASGATWTGPRALSDVMKR